jgi:hypothetical protein
VGSNPTLSAIESRLSRFSSKTSQMSAFTGISRS